MKHKTIYIYALVFFFAGLFQSCRDNYTIVPTEQEQMAIFTNGVFSNIVKFGSTGYGLALKSDNQIALAKLGANNKFELVADLSGIFNIRWNLDSLEFLRFGKAGDYLAIFQQKGYWNGDWKLTLIDTTGKTITSFTDTMRISTYSYPTFLGAFSDGQTIKIYFTVYDQNFNRSILAQTYDMSGFMMYARIVDFDKINSIFTGEVFWLNDGLAFMGLSYSEDTTYFVKIDYDLDKVVYNIALGNYYYLWGIPVDQDKAIIAAFRDYQPKLDLLYVDFSENGGLIWSLNSDTVKGFIPMSCLRFDNEYIIMGFSMKEMAYKFSILDVPKQKEFMSMFSTDGSRIFWQKSFNYEKIIPVGYLQVNDTLYTGFGFGRTFNYFPATYVFKFNQFGKFL